MKLKLHYFGHLMWRTDSFERPWCWERLKAGGEGDNRRWDGWMASLTQWTWVWVNSRSWWWTERRGILQSMGSQRVGHKWATELKKYEEPPNSMKNNEIINTLEGSNSRLYRGTAAQQTRRQSYENPPSWTEKRNKRIFKNEDNVRKFKNNIKHTNICNIGVLE